MTLPLLILGSASPRRKELLAQIGIIPDRIIGADIDETPRRHERPRDYVMRMAHEKAMSFALNPGEVVLSADTVVIAGRRILGKPKDEVEARAFLTLLSGRRHRVLTAIVVRDATSLRERLVQTQIRFRPLNRLEIDAYLASGEWQGKAGGYAIQGRAAAFAPWIEGSFSAVVGLPLAETAQLLAAAGITGQERP